MLILEIITVVLTLAIAGNTILHMIGLERSRTNLAPRPKGPESHILQPITPFILIVIPVLREQNTISSTLRHFQSMDYPRSRYAIIVSTTERESQERKHLRQIVPTLIDSIHRSSSYAELEEVLLGVLPKSIMSHVFLRRHVIQPEELLALYDSQPSTQEVAEQWVEQYKHAHGEQGCYSVYCVCTPDSHGNRATQINFAVWWAIQNLPEKPDIIGIYDADSRPESSSLVLAAISLQNLRVGCCQQPLQYLDAANELSAQGANPILVGNALWQTTWSLIREWPILDSYEHWVMNRRSSKFHRSLYLNGHGEFLTRELWEQLSGVPEGVTTDGIQLGYRLSMLGIPVKPLWCFCSDEVPKRLKALFMQHMRWYAGNLEFLVALKWASNHSATPSILQILDNIMLNIKWAFGLPIVVVTFILLFFGINGTLRFILLGSLVATMLIYTYALPFWATRIPGIAVRVRLIDWAALPLAIAFKSLGPLALVCIRLLNLEKSIKLAKVER